MRAVIVALLPVVAGALVAPGGSLAAEGTGGRPNSVVATDDPAAASQADPPNVLMILTDDQRAGTLSVMPRTRRWFKRGGVSYPSAFATTPVCCPSRASIMTGRYAHNHDVNTNREPRELDHETTIQRYLRDAGYRTGFLGRYLNAWPLLEPPPHFDRWAMMAPARHRDATFNLNGRIRTVRGYSTVFLARRAARMIRSFEAGGKPWFILLSTLAPHKPLQPAARYRDAKVPALVRNPSMLERDRSDKPPHVQQRSHSLRRAIRIRRQQLRMLMSVDDLVGEVMKALGETGARKETLAFYLSDHGYLWADHGLRGKGHPYSAAIRLPLFARWPGRIRKGSVDTRMAANIDVPATILDAAGIPVTDPPVDGRSLLGPAVRDRLFTEAWPESIVLHWASIRTGAYHYVEYYDEDTGGIAFREYYDLVNDPWELRNLLGDADPRNDPPSAFLARLSLQVARDAACEGTTGASACP